MIEAPPVDDRFEATIGALGRIDHELVAARATIVQQQKAIEQLRLEASAALRAEEQALELVMKANVMIKGVRAHAAQVEGALQAERTKCMHLSDELASITEQVSLTFGTLLPGNAAAQFSGKKLGQ